MYLFSCTVITHPAAREQNALVLIMEYKVYINSLTYEAMRSTAKSVCFWVQTLHSGYLYPNIWPHGSLDVLIVVFTIAESLVRRNTKLSSLPRTATPETTRFRSTWITFLSFGDMRYSTGLSTDIPTTILSVVLLCPEDKLMWPVSIWNRRVSFWTPLLGSCSRWPVNSRLCCSRTSETSFERSAPLNYDHFRGCVISIEGHVPNTSGRLRIPVTACGTPLRYEQSL
jgi:hypothetical protein